MKNRAEEQRPSSFTANSWGRGKQRARTGKEATQRRPKRSLLKAQCPLLLVIALTAAVTCSLRWANAVDAIIHSGEKNLHVSSFPEDMEGKFFVPDSHNFLVGISRPCRVAFRGLLWLSLLPLTKQKFSRQNFPIITLKVAHGWISTCQQQLKSTGITPLSL